jgi:hypothetical protein
VPTKPNNKLSLLCVYDGHKVGVGRVVTDSSFHHYIDLNLIGGPCGVGEKQHGFTTAAGAPILANLKQFFINTVVWLARVPKNKVLDDVTLKASEDTNKFSDDVSLKAIDDKNKVLDDVTIMEAAGVGGTVKFADDGGTVKALDDVKISGRGAGQAGTSETPFILATPHHSFAWARAGGTEQKPQLSDYQVMIAQYDATLASLEQAMQKSLGEIQGLDAQYRQMLEAYRVLVKEYLAMYGPKAAP